MPGGLGSLTSVQADAQKTETNAQTAYDKLMVLLKAAHKEMSDSYEGKQKALGGNDGDLATKRKQETVFERDWTSHLGCFLPQPTSSHTGVPEYSKMFQNGPR